jgi:hypothetical protein
MYREGTFEGDIGRDVTVCTCSAEGPQGRFVCTRGDGHTGPHRAGVARNNWVAEWDENRSTDTTEDFFDSIGL